jgi:16S rRNA (cytidine1402-2'-O)-methyltransferase
LSKPTARDSLPRGAAAAGLYLVATPIGNLADITLRALHLLSKADVIACEDTRVTRKLLAAHGLRTPMTTYHEHNAERVRPRLIEHMKCGKAVALVSDAGTPLISDPGYKLVRAAAAAGIPVTALPGASAALAALVVSGLPSDRFLYAGFLPAKAAARRQALRELATVPATLIVYESARRLPAALADMAAVLGPRPAAVARELTKLHEEVRRETLETLAAHYAAAGPPRGEVVVVIGPPAEAAAMDTGDLDAHLRAALATESLRDAVAAVAALTGLPRQQVYARALELRRRGAQP